MVAIEPVLTPGASATALSFVAGGVALGTVSGLTPGIHANNFALLLAGAAPSIPGPPRFVAAAMLAAGVAHTFLDVVPSLTFGVPDAAMAVAALPGHRLVIEGRGHEALRLSAFGSTVAVCVAMIFAVPVTRVMVAIYPHLRAHLTLVLGLIAIGLLALEPSWYRRLGALQALVASGLLGVLALDVEPAAPLDAGGMLAPLFAGLFGAPVLVEATRGQGVPEQGDTTVAMSRLALARTALAGSLSGASVAYLPGVSSAIAATAALFGVPARAGARGFVVATSGVNTANTVFGVFALLALGTPRNGVLVAMEQAGLPVRAPLLLATVAVAAAVSAISTILLGDRYLRVIGRLDVVRVSATVLLGLVALSWLFAGWQGVVALVVAGLVGAIPVRYGARRVHLMGVLLVPIALGP
jgi:putative membrane protein